jgi:hypothetical protein
MTVAEMRERMSSQEMLMWSVYYARRNQERELEEKRAAAPKRGRRR